MPKRKQLAKRLSDTQRKALKAELAKASGREAKAMLARKYVVTWKNVDYHAQSMKTARRAKVVAPATPEASVYSVKQYNPKITGRLARGAGVSLRTSAAMPPSPHAQPNGTLRCTLEIPRARVEEIVRSETRHEVQNMLRGIAGK